MASLVRVDLDILPQDPAFRPVQRHAWYSRAVPVAAAVGAGIGLLAAYLSPIVVGAALAAVLGWSVTRRRKLSRLLRDNDDGVALLASGEVADAAATFDRLCADARRMPAMHSLLVYNRGVAHLESGELDQALALFSAVIHAGWIAERGTLSVYYGAVLGRMAITEALRGRVDEADGWRARAHAATSAARRGSLLLVDAVVEGRRGRGDRVADLVEEAWRRAENLLTAHQLRSIRVVEAFCLERGTASEYRAVARDGDFQQALASARAGRRGEFDHLGADWPEMADFLARHGLDGNATPLTPDP